jgi:hypothetical protein
MADKYMELLGYHYSKSHLMGFMFCILWRRNPISYLFIQYGYKNQICLV